MQYTGSKARLGKFLKDNILPHREGRSSFLEPFCGALGATIHLQPDVASDGCKGLVDMHNALQRGWLPPVDKIDEDFFRAHREDDTALGAFLSHGCSFGGAYMSGFARPKVKGGDVQNYVLEAANLAWKKANRCRNVDIVHRNYSDIIFEGNEIVYCDPPYLNTEQRYKVNRGKANTFDTPAFWDWVKYNAEKHDVLFFISEFSAPEWVNRYADVKRTGTTQAGKGQPVVDVLYSYGNMKPELNQSGGLLQAMAG